MMLAQFTTSTKLHVLNTADGPGAMGTRLRGHSGRSVKDWQGRDRALYSRNAFQLHQWVGAARGVKSEGE